MLTDISEYQPAIKLAPLAHNDHCCVLVKGQVFKNNSYVRITKRLVTPERKNSCLAELAATDWGNVLHSPSVHTKVAQLHKTVNELLDKHCPTKTFKVRSDRPQWMTSSILKLIRAREEAHRKGCASYKFLRSLVQRAIRSSKRKFVNEQLNNQKDTKAWWDTVKLLTKPPHPISNENRRTIISGEPLLNHQLAEKLNAYYKEVGGEPVPPPQSSSDRPANPSNPLQPISIGEVKQMLSKLDPTKATNTEDFPTWVSKEGREDICIPMHNIINKMLADGEYPDFWKQSQVKPLPKTKQPAQLKDYRPISLLFHLGKVAEQAIVNKLKGPLKDVFASNQYAYRPKLGTTDAILQLIYDTTADLDLFESKFVQLASLDFSKAFDKLQPSIVIAKMRNYGINENILKLVESFLSNRKQSVKVDSVISESMDIFVGAPQGTKLGPLLWLFYINDLQVDNYRAVKYADDTSFYRTVCNPGSASVAPAIQATLEWSNNNCMSLNAEKTEIMNIRLNYRSSYDDEILVNDNISIKPTECTKFLGVHIDNHLSFSKHVDHIISKCSSRMYLLRQLKILGMNAEGLKTFYCSNIRSLLSYAAPAWFTLLGDTDSNRLEKAQRTAT